MAFILRFQERVRGVSTSKLISTEVATATLTEVRTEDTDYVASKPFRTFPQ